MRLSQVNIFLGVELLLYLQSSYHETLIIIFIQNDNKLENVYEFQDLSIL